MKINNHISVVLLIWILAAYNVSYSQPKLNLKKMQVFYSKGQVLNKSKIEDTSRKVLIDAISGLTPQFHLIYADSSLMISPIHLSKNKKSGLFILFCPPFHFVEPYLYFFYSGSSVYVIPKFNKSSYHNIVYPLLLDSKDPFSRKNIRHIKRYFKTTD